MNIRKITEGAKFEIPDGECGFAYDNPKAYYGRNGWYMYDSDGNEVNPDEKYLVFPTENFLDDEKCLKIINELDSFARSIDSREYGLPVGWGDDDPEEIQMKNIIRSIFSE